MNRLLIIFLLITLITGCKTKTTGVDSEFKNTVDNSVAQSNVDQAGKKIPANISSHFHQGNKFLAEKKYQNAIEKYEIVIKLKPDYVQAHYNLGVAYYDTNRTEYAIQEWNKAVELDPEYTKVYLSLGYAYEKLDNKDKAVENYDKYLQMKPDDPNAALISKRINALRGNLRGEGLIGQITLSDKINSETNEAVAPKDMFNENTKVIYTTAEIGDAPDNTVIKASWYYLGLKTEEIEVNTREKIISGPQKMIFEITKPAKTPWPAGRYEIRIFVNGKENLSVPFTVLKGGNKQNAPGKNS